MCNDVNDIIREMDIWNLDAMTSLSLEHPHAENIAEVSCWDAYKDADVEKHAPVRTPTAPAETKRTVCIDCNADTRTEDGGFFVCSLCGDVGEAFVDDTPEWRYYGQDDSKSGDPSRCGISSNYLMPESSIGTVISTRYGESYRMRQARQYHSWNVMDYRGRNLYRIFDKLQTQSQKHGINYIIIEHAKQLYKTVSSHQLFRGKNKEGLIADCVYRACKDKGVPRSVKEIAIIFDIEEHVMTKGNRCFTSVWNRIKSEDASKLPAQSNRSLQLACPSDYIARFCSPLRLTNDILEDCIKVCKLVQTNRLVPDNTAPSIAAAVVYYVTNAHMLNISKEDIAKSSKKSEVTIGKCFKKLTSYDLHLRSCMKLDET